MIDLECAREDCKRKHTEALAKERKLTKEVDDKTKKILDLQEQIN